MEITEFELIKDGHFGGELGSEKKPYNPLLFSGGKITIEQGDDAIHISVDESTKTNLDFSIEEVMHEFNKIDMEDLMTRTSSRYRIKIARQIDYLNPNQLFSVQKVIDGYTFVLVPIVE